MKNSISSSIHEKPYNRMPENVRKLNNIDIGNLFF